LWSVTMYMLQDYIIYIHVILAKSVPLTVCTWKISKQITRNDNHWIWKRKLIVVISQWLIVVTHHGIHASRSCKSAVTHKVHQNQDLTTKFLFFLFFQTILFFLFPIWAVTVSQIWQSYNSLVIIVNNVGNPFFGS